MKKKAFDKNIKTTLKAYGFDVLVYAFVIALANIFAILFLLSATGLVSFQKTIDTLYSQKSESGQWSQDVIENVNELMINDISNFNTFIIKVSVLSLASCLLFILIISFLKNNLWNLYREKKIKYKSIFLKYLLDYSVFIALILISLIIMSDTGFVIFFYALLLYFLYYLAVCNAVYDDKLSFFKNSIHGMKLSFKRFYVFFILFCLLFVGFVVAFAISYIPSALKTFVIVPIILFGLIFSMFIVHSRKIIVYFFIKKEESKKK